MNNFIRVTVLVCCYVLVLLLVNYVHMRYFPVNVVLYASVLDAFISTAILFAGAALLKLLSGLSRLEVVLVALLCLVGGYTYAISVPTVLDRSLSFYILEKLAQRGGGIQRDRMEDVFTQEYMKEHRLVDIRLTEQLQSGTIEISNGCVELTPKGKDLAKLSRWYRSKWLPTHRLIMGKYTDALTDPFRSSIATPNYTCGKGS